MFVYGTAEVFLYKPGLNFVPEFNKIEMIFLIECVSQDWLPECSVVYFGKWVLWEVLILWDAW